LYRMRRIKKLVCEASKVQFWNFYPKPNVLDNAIPFPKLVMSWENHSVIQITHTHTQKITSDQETTTKKFTRMNVRMLLHIGFLMKSFSAERTRIRARVRVNKQMCRERRRPLERLSALRTGKRFLNTVHSSN